MKNFISLIKQHPLDFVDALERRKSTSPNNKHLHQKMIDLVEANDYDGVVSFLEKDEPYYKHNQLEGVVLVFTDYDWSIKTKIYNSYTDMITKENIKYEF